MNEKSTIRRTRKSLDFQISRYTVDKSPPYPTGTLRFQKSPYYLTVNNRRINVTPRKYIYIYIYFTRYEVFTYVSLPLSLSLSFPMYAAHAYITPPLFIERYPSGVSVTR